MAVKSTLPSELLTLVFQYLTPQQNAANARVCKGWQDPATDVAKRQILARTQDDILQKAEAFLCSVPHQLENYCPQFKRLREMGLERNNYTFQIIHQATLDAVKQKYIICMTNFFSTRLRKSAQLGPWPLTLALRCRVRSSCERFVPHYFSGIHLVTNAYSVDYLPPELDSNVLFP